MVTNVLTSFGGARCVSLLQAAFSALVRALGAPPGRASAAKLLRACSVPKSAADGGVLMGAVQGALQSLVQYNTHGSATGGGARASRA